MARRHSVLHTWSLSAADELAVPNARICFALLRSIRRLPGAFPAHEHESLGALLTSAMQTLRRPLRKALTAHMKAPLVRAVEVDLPDDAALLHDQHVQRLLGEALSRALPCFKDLFDKVEEQLARFVSRHSHPSDQNVVTLTAMLSLPEPEVRFLTLAVAFNYGTVERSLFSFVDSNSKLLRVIEVLCEIKGPKALRLFDNDRPLARSGLFEALTGERLGRDLEDLLVLSSAGDRLLSTPFCGPAEMAEAVLTPLPPRASAIPLEWPHLAEPKALLQAALATALAEKSVGFNVLLHGAPGTGKTEFARTLVADLGAAGFAIDHTDPHGAEASRANRLGSLRLSQTFASQHHHSLLVLDEAEDVFRGDHNNPFARLMRRPAESKAWMNQLLESNVHPVIWISNQASHMDPAYLRRFAFCLEFPKTPFALRRRVAESQLAAAGCVESTIDAFAADENVTPALMASAVRFVAMSASSGLGADIAAKTLLNEHAKAAGRVPVPARRATALRYDMRYLNVRGNTSPQALLDALRGAEPSAAVFSGSPGTGKTQFAAEIAKALGRRLVVRTASDINSKWYGESEGNVAKMFRETDPMSELLFLDEAEVLLSSRTETDHRADRAVTAEFLRWLEVFEGVFICATNHAAAFDAALVRRFSYRLEFLPLDRRQREELFVECALDHGGVPCKDQTRIDDRTVTRLGALDLLTPGDFANASRRIRQLKLPVSTFIEELEGEQAAKGARRPSIGFL